MSEDAITFLREQLGDEVLEVHDRLGDDTAVVARTAWRRACRLLKEEQGFAMLLDLCGVDRLGATERFEVVAHLLNLEEGKRVRVKTRCPERDPSVASLSELFPAADWFEREAFDLMGIRFEGHPNLKRLLCHHEFEGHPLRKDFPKDRRGKIPTPDTLFDEMEAGGSSSKSPITNHQSRMYLNIGPSHPAMHACFRVLAELSGERILRAVPEIGYLHRCFEKEAEAHPWLTVIPYTDRLNYVSPLMNNVGYCMAVEKLAGIEVPLRAQWIRMLCCEVSRIWDHLVSVGANLVDIGLFSAFWYLFNAREFLTDWIEALSGARLTTTYARIGGVARDLPTGTGKQLAACLVRAREAIRDVRRMIDGNRIFLDRTQGIGAISEEEAVAAGFTGPCLRAAGVPYDVRRAHPYLLYDDVSWDIPIGTRGDTYDRILVRIEEMEQSAQIIEQILAKIPTGPIVADRPEMVLPQPYEVYNTMEGMIRHFELIQRGMRVPAGEAYGYTEAANGELGFYIISDGSERPYRIKVRPPCFPIYQAFPKLIRGHLVADAVAIIGSLNIIAGELDR
jgi:NADH-quinone oxidoreductase subunit C/D